MPVKEMPVEIFDLDQLRSYTLGDRDLEDEVFGLFEAGALDYLTALEAALGAGGEAWRRAAHGFKGSAANLGARALAAELAAAEPLATADAAARAAALHTIRHLFEHSRAVSRNRR